MDGVLQRRSSARSPIPDGPPIACELCFRRISNYLQPSLDDEGSSSKPLPERLPGWQRGLRHLRAVTFAGLPFEPTSSGALSVELQPLPPTARVRLRLRARNLGVEALCMVVEDGAEAVPPELAGKTLSRGGPVACSTHAQWLLDPAALPDGAGTLAGALIVVRQAERPNGGAVPAADAAATAEPRIVWQRAVRFAELPHLVVDDTASLARMLPLSGVLLLRFADGVCGVAGEPAALSEYAGLTEPPPPPPPQPSSSTNPFDDVERERPASARAVEHDSFVTEVQKLSGRCTCADAANTQARIEVEGQLKGRAARAQRKSELAAHETILAALRERQAAAIEAIVEEQRRIDALKAELAAGRLRIEASAQAEAEILEEASKAREAAEASRVSLEQLEGMERTRRQQLLLELSAALPVGAPGGRPSVGSGGSAAVASSSGGSRVSLLLASALPGMAATAMVAVAAMAMVVEVVEEVEAAAAVMRKKCLRF